MSHHVFGDETPKQLKSQTTPQQITQQVPQQTHYDNLRIVALAPHIVEMLFELGLGDNIVGTVEYADYPEQAKNIPRVGGYYGMQIEKILELEPDIVFAWKSGNKVDDLSQLTRLKLNVAYSHPDKIDDVANELRRFAEIVQQLLVDKPVSQTLNKNTQVFIEQKPLLQQAEEVALRFEKRLAAVRQQYQNKKLMNVFYQLWPQPMMTINKNTWIHQVIDTCRGYNVFANTPTDYPKISIENVLVTQPDIIVLPDEKSTTPQSVIQWKKWSEMPAVKANAFISVNADLLHRFTPRMLDGVEKLCADIDLYR